MLKNKLFPGIGALALLAFAAAGGAWIYLNNVSGGDLKAQLVAQTAAPVVTLSASPSSFTNGTGSKTTINWSINVPASIFMNVRGGNGYTDTVYYIYGDSNGGTVNFDAGNYSANWYGTNQSTGLAVPAGSYNIHMAATSPTIGWIYKDIYVTVTAPQTTPSISLSASPTSFNNATGGKTTVNWSINVPASISMSVSGNTNYTDTIFYIYGGGNGELQSFNAGNYSATWNGTNQFTGKAVPAGSYKIHMAATSSTIGWIYKDIYVTVTSSGSTTTSPTTTTPTTTTKPSTTTKTPTTVKLNMFSDLNLGGYKDAINLLANRGIISGYPDGTFKPTNAVNRAELLKIVFQAGINSGLYEQGSLDMFAQQSCFSDVQANQWYTKYVCAAKANNIVSGYNDGTFKPSQTVTMGEAFKISLKAFRYSYVNKDPWYSGIVEAIQGNNLFPEIYERPDLEPMRRDKVAELVTRFVLNQEGKLQDYINNPESVK